MATALEAELQRTGLTLDQYAAQKKAQHGFDDSKVFDVPGYGGAWYDEKTGTIRSADWTTDYKTVATVNPNDGQSVEWHNANPQAQAYYSAYQRSLTSTKAPYSYTDPTGTQFQVDAAGNQTQTGYAPTLYTTDTQSKALLQEAAPGGTVYTQPIANPAPAPVLGAAAPGPTFSTPSGTTAAASYTTGVAQQVDSAKQALLDEANRRAAEYDAKIKEFEKKELEYQQLADSGMLDYKNTVFAESAEKRAAFDLEKQRFDENYNANQALIGELDMLLTQGNEAIKRMEGTTGLSSIMNPRIAQTMSDVAARAGVIQAVMSARSGQMSQAQSQLNTSLNAIESIYGDQITYYKDVVNYYSGLKAEVGEKITNLDKAKEQFANVKIGLLEQDLEVARATAASISKALMDPETAMMYAKAGITLMDSPQTINQKLAAYQYSQEVSNISNTLSQKGYSKTPISGVTPVEITDSYGTVHRYYKAPDPSDPAEQFTLGTNQVRFDAAGNVVAKGPTPAETQKDELAELLSPAEAKALGVPYGTTKGQAAKTIPAASPAGYPTVELQPGSSNSAAVTQLQQYLVAQGYMTQAEMDTGPGIYGPKTTAAVAKLQQKLGVDTSGGGVGSYGPRTLAALQGKAYATPPAAKTPKEKVSYSSDLQQANEAIQAGADPVAAKRMFLDRFGNSTAANSAWNAYFPN